MTISSAHVRDISHVDLMILPAALWVPFFVVTLMASGQLVLGFFGQTMTLCAAQDATHAYASVHLPAKPK